MSLGQGRNAKEEDSVWNRSSAIPVAFHPEGRIIAFVGLFGTCIGTEHYAAPVVFAGTPRHLAWRTPSQLTDRPLVLCPRTVPHLFTGGTVDLSETI